MLHADSAANRVSEGERQKQEEQQQQQEEQEQQQKVVDNPTGLQQGREHRKREKYWATDERATRDDAAAASASLTLDPDMKLMPEEPADMLKQMQNLQQRLCGRAATIPHSIAANSGKSGAALVEALSGQTPSPPFDQPQAWVNPISVSTQQSNVLSSWPNSAWLLAANTASATTLLPLLDQRQTMPLPGTRWVQSSLAEEQLLQQVWRLEQLQQAQRWFHQEWSPSSSLSIHSSATSTFFCLLPTVSPPLEGIHSMKPIPSVSPCNAARDTDKLAGATRGRVAVAGDACTSKTTRYRSKRECQPAEAASLRSASKTKRAKVEPSTAKNAKRASSKIRSKKLKRATRKSKQVEAENACSAVQQKRPSTGKKSGIDPSIRQEALEKRSEAMEAARRSRTLSWSNACQRASAAIAALPPGSLVYSVGNLAGDSVSEIDQQSVRDEMVKRVAELRSGTAPRKVEDPVALVMYIHLRDDNNIKGGIDFRNFLCGCGIRVGASVAYAGLRSFGLIHSHNYDQIGKSSHLFEQDLGSAVPKLSPHGVFVATELFGASNTVKSGPVATADSRTKT